MTSISLAHTVERLTEIRDELDALVHEAQALVRSVAPDKLDALRPLDDDGNDALTDAIHELEHGDEEE